MNKLTFEKMDLIYTDCSEDDTCQELIESYNEMCHYLDIDEAKPLALKDAVMEKCEDMADTEFADLELFPDFYKEEDDYER